jgi:hypothetical protein
MPALLAEGASSAQAALKLLGSEDEGSEAFLRGVLCLIPDGTEPVYARIRLVARSVVQALLAVEFQGPITVCLNPLDPVRVGTKRELIELFQRAVDYIFKHQGEARVEVPLPRGAIWDGSGVVSIWSSHHYHERLSKATRADLSNGRKGGAWQLTMPPDAWLLCRDRALLEILEAPYLGRVIERLESDDDWLIFLFHCASTMPSGDFDPAVALFEECSSPLWSLRVLIERFGRFAPSVPLPTPLASLARCSTDHAGGDRELFIRSLAMPFYAARAIALSDLEGWCGAIERLAKGGHAFINSPSIRLALEKGGLDGRQSEIATSLGFGLSCIMNIVMEN